MVLENTTLLVENTQNSAFVVTEVEAGYANFQNGDVINIITCEKNK